MVNADDFLRSDGLPASNAEDLKLRSDLRAGSTPISQVLLQNALHRAHSALDQEHRTLTGTWRAPLSLFSKKDQEEASRNGVPTWAVDIVCRVQGLVAEAAALGDSTDAYKATLSAASFGQPVPGPRGNPSKYVLELLENLDDLTAKLHVEQSRLVLARIAFDKPAEAAQEDPCITPGKDLCAVRSDDVASSCMISSGVSADSTIGPTSKHGDYAFLPKMLNGDTVLVSSGFRGTWCVSLPPNSALALRASKQLTDRMDEMVHRGAFVDGVDEGDGWIRCHMPFVQPVECGSKTLGFQDQSVSGLWGSMVKVGKNAARVSGAVSKVGKQAAHGAIAAAAEAKRRAAPSPELKVALGAHLDAAGRGLDAAVREALAVTSRVGEGVILGSFAFAGDMPEFGRNPQAHQRDQAADPEPEQQGRLPWNKVWGRPSPYLSVEETVRDHRTLDAKLKLHLCEHGHDSAQSRWERCRRGSERRWSLP